MSDSNIKKTDNSLLRTGTGGVSEKDDIYRQAAINRDALRKSLRDFLKEYLFKI